jgi:uncharacterized protein YjiS (DUF1127 family)
MQSTWSRPIPLPRPAWLRVADAAVDAMHAAGASLHRLWRRWQGSRQKARELHSLRQLSPRALRDIGADPQWINEAQRLHERNESTREAFLRGL